MSSKLGSEVHTRRWKTGIAMCSTTPTARCPNNGNIGRARAIQGPRLWDLDAVTAMSHIDITLQHTAGSTLLIAAEHDQFPDINLYGMIRPHHERPSN